MLDVADLSTEHRLNCGQTGTYYRWKRRQKGLRYYKQINNRNPGKYANTTSRILSLLRVKRNEYGSYRCTYQNNGWHDVDFYLVVQGKTFKIITINQNIYLMCICSTKRKRAMDVN